jgi:hypothetical protein
MTRRILSWLARSRDEDGWIFLIPLVKIAAALAAAAIVGITVAYIVTTPPEPVVLPEFPTPGLSDLYAGRQETPVKVPSLPEQSETPATPRDIQEGLVDHPITIAPTLDDTFVDVTSKKHWEDWIDIPGGGRGWGRLESEDRPGEGLGHRIHLQWKQHNTNSPKYYWNPTERLFVDAYGNPAPNAINKNKSLKNRADRIHRMLNPMGSTLTE